MKRVAQLITVMSFVGMFLVSPVTAVTSQGLEWGAAQNDEFTFRYTIVEEGVTILDEGVNFTIGSAPSIIDDPVTTWFFPPPSISMMFTNGTYLPPIRIFEMEINVINTVGQFVVPIGNFTLLSELLQDTPRWAENCNLVNDESKWGVHVAADETEESRTLDVHYLKEDGFISRYDYQVTNTTSGVASRTTLIRDGLGPDIIGFLIDNILYVGIGLVVVLILAVVCKRRK